MTIKDLSFCAESSIPWRSCVPFSSDHRAYGSGLNTERQFLSLTLKLPFFSRSDSLFFEPGRPLLEKQVSVNTALRRECFSVSPSDVAPLCLWPYVLGPTTRTRESKLLRSYRFRALERPLMPPRPWRLRPNTGDEGPVSRVRHIIRRVRCVDVLS